MKVPHAEKERNSPPRLFVDAHYKRPTERSKSTYDDALRNPGGIERTLGNEPATTPGVVSYTPAGPRRPV